MPRIHVTDDIAETAALLLAKRIGAAIHQTGRCRLGLSGGSTPGPILKRLASYLSAQQTAALWVTWVDERHPEASNEALARAVWLDAAARDGVAPTIVPMVRGGTLSEDTIAFAAAFEAELGSALDVALLGAGPDGHIASLFAGHDALAATAPVVAIRDSPKPPPTRITLTLPVLRACPAVVLVARGAGKAAALREALAGCLPLGRLAPEGAYDWVLDPAAAGQLEDT